MKKNNKETIATIMIIVLFAYIGLSWLDIVIHNVPYTAHNYNTYNLFVLLNRLFNMF